MSVTDTYDFFALIILFRELNTSSCHETYFAVSIINMQTNHNHFTSFGRNCNFIPPQIRKWKCYASFLYKSYNLWNNLPLNIKNSISLNVFENRGRAYLWNNVVVWGLRVHAFVCLHVNNRLGNASIGLSWAKVSTVF